MSPAFWRCTRPRTIELWLYAHILSGELLLVAIPATKLCHVVGFFLSRGQIGADFGIKRGYKGKGFAW